jgi:hypothetical protein
MKASLRCAGLLQRIIFIFIHRSFSVSGTIRVAHSLDLTFLHI